MSNHYGIELKEAKDIKDVDVVILAVPHEEYKELSLEEIGTFYNDNYAHINGNKDTDDKKVFVDVKGMFDRDEAEKMGYLYWRL